MPRGQGALLAEAPPAAPPVAAPAALPEPGRFGPGVTEVEVAGPGAPAVAPGVGTPPAVAVPPPPRPEAPPPPPGASRAPPAPTQARGEGTHALQVGVYRSQRYRQEAEESLQSRSLPHFRVPGSKIGTGYRVTAAAEGEAGDRALGLLGAADYLARRTPRGVEADFHLEEEAQAALALLTKAGFAGGYARVQGPLPLWTVYAGPFPEAEARKTQKALADQGIPTQLRRKP